MSIGHRHLNGITVLRWSWGATVWPNFAAARADPNIGDMVQREHPKIRVDYTCAMRFRLVPKSMTLDDLERPKRTLAEKSFYGAHRRPLRIKSRVS